MREYKQHYEVGEPCWAHCGVRDPKTGKYVMSPGRVLVSFGFDEHMETFYVIKLLDANFPHFIVRDALLMSGDPDVNPPMVLATYNPDGLRLSETLIGFPAGVPLHVAKEMQAMVPEVPMGPGDIEGNIVLGEDEDNDEGYEYDDSDSQD